MVETYLLDVNVLVALVRSKHSHHEQVRRWFASVGGKSWATCPMTQAGFVRVVSNPRFTAQAVNVSEAMQMLSELSGLPGHQFWPIDFDFADAVHPVADRFMGHQQVSDIYLLAVALRNKGKLATLDGAFDDLAGKDLKQFVAVL